MIAGLSGLLIVVGIGGMVFSVVFGPDDEVEERKGWQR